MNYVFFFDVMAKCEANHLPVQLAGAPAAGNTISGWVGQTAPYFLWVELAVQILVFPLLALAVERGLYANNRKGRSFQARPESSAAIETTQLEKHYRPSMWKRIFCCSRNKALKAVDGLDLTSQKNQILCLLGPNGSGKSTTLDMIAGFQAPTQGSIAINAMPSDMGICPQKNVLWDNLTVSEHVVLWNQIKGSVDSHPDLEALLETCDLTLKKKCLSKNLSGGMKRKLQLACALVGGSSVCLMVSDGPLYGALLLITSCLAGRGVFGAGPHLSPCNLECHPPGEIAANNGVYDALPGRVRSALGSRSHPLARQGELQRHAG